VHPTEFAFGFFPGFLAIGGEEREGGGKGRGRKGRGEENEGGGKVGGMEYPDFKNSEKHHSE